MKNKFTLFYIFIILLITFIVYSESLFNGFINLDDTGYIIYDNAIKHFTLNGIAKIFTSINMANYHPLTILSYSIEYKVFGANAFVYHLDNLILHLINILMVFIFIRILINKDDQQSTNIALLVAFLFGIIVCMLNLLHGFRNERIYYILSFIYCH